MDGLEVEGFLDLGGRGGRQVEENEGGQDEEEEVWPT